MPCCCGDIYCPSCGPAQGNTRCEWCGRWSSDGGCADANACLREIDRMYDELAEQFRYEREVDE